MADEFSLIGYIQGKLKQYVCYTRVDSYQTFFKDGLNFSAQDAGLLAHLYLATCDVFDVVPGLGAPKANARTTATPADLKGEFTILGIGKFTVGLASLKFEMKLADYLGGQANSGVTIRSLTPAKRDALRAEAAKLLKVPGQSWKRYYENRFASSGVRG